MDCPYPDCDSSSLEEKAPGCRLCGRRTRPCPKCAQLNRAFARYCRTCGERLPVAPGQWLGFQGGADRRGLHSFRLSRPLSALEILEQGQLTLSAACASLLFYEGFLFAVAEDGTVTAMELSSRRIIGPWRAAQSATAAACIAHGLLFVAGGDHVTATPLAGLARSKAPEARGSATLPGHATDALLVLDRRLYVTVEGPRGLREIVGLDLNLDSGRARLGACQSLYQGSVVGSPVGSSASPSTAFFLTEEDHVLFLHHVAPRQAAVRRPLQQAPTSLAWQTPIASIGKHLFAVMGKRRELWRVNLETARCEEELASDVRAFAVGGVRDALAIQATGLFSVARNQEEVLSESLKGSPLLWRETAAIVGLADGRAQLHDWQNLASFKQIRVSTKPQAGVTALAAYQNLLAAGSEDGNVKIFRLVLEQGTPA